MKHALAGVRRYEFQSESKFARLVGLLYRYRIFRKICIIFIKYLEGGELYSKTLRKLLLKHNNVSVGSYSYGSCLEPYVLPRNTSVGNYCSFAAGLRVLRRNHPAAFLSQHPFFFNSDLGLLTQDSIESVEMNPLTIGHDVWIGSDVLILPGCRRIGNGAIVGAGSVVTRDVPDFAIVAGNPARKIRERFDARLCNMIMKSQWWDLPLSDLVELVGDMMIRPIRETDIDIFLTKLDAYNRR